MGVDNIFSFTGDLNYLQRMLPLVDRSLAYVQAHADKHGLSTLIPVGQGW